MDFIQKLGLNYQHPLDHGKSKRVPKNIYFCFIDYAKAFDCVDHNNLRQDLFNYILGFFGCFIISFLIMLLFWVSFSYLLLNPFILFNSYFNYFNFFLFSLLYILLYMFSTMHNRQAFLQVVFLHDNFSFFYLLPEFYQLISYFFSLPHHFFPEFLL